MEKPCIRINIDQMDPDLIARLAEAIGSIAVRAFDDPAVQERFQEWKKEKAQQIAGEADCCANPEA